MTHRQIKKLASDLIKYKDIHVSSYATVEFEGKNVEYKEIINAIYSHIALTLKIIDLEEKQNLNNN